MKLGKFRPNINVNLCMPNGEQVQRVAQRECRLVSRLLALRVGQHAVRRSR